MKTFIFIGPGRCVPGLPHKITDARATELSVEKLLAEAVKAGLYEEVKPPAPKKEQENKAARITATQKE